MLTKIGTKLNKNNK